MMTRMPGGISLFSACLFFLLATLPPPLISADWPEFRGTDRTGVWNAEGLIDSFDGLSDPLPRVWTSPVGAGYSGPTVAGEGVYLMDRGEPGSNEEVERVVCVDRATGNPRWIHTYPCVYGGIDYGYGPRTSVTVRDGKAWALGMMGHLHCLDAESGQLIWAKDLGKEYKIQMPIWGLSASPLVEGDVLVVQVSAPDDGACFVGFDRNTGTEKWRAFADRGSYVSPVMITQAGQRILAAWSGQRIAGMDAATGKVHWEIPAPYNKILINFPVPAFN